MRQSEGARVTLASESSTRGNGRRAIPLRRRRRDLLFVAFFLLNLSFITYVVDVEQLIIADPAHFQYPLWPPAPLVDLVHWWGRTFDPLLLARPVWWKMTIWIDALGFGPFYVVALYAFLRGRHWIPHSARAFASFVRFHKCNSPSDEAMQSGGGIF